MKTIYTDEYQKDGIFIDLETDYYYEELIYDPERYLNREDTHYVWCRGGVKSGIVVRELLEYGYKAIRVISR